MNQIVMKRERLSPFCATHSDIFFVKRNFSRSRQEAFFHFCPKLASFHELTPYHIAFDVYVLFPKSNFAFQTNLKEFDNIVIFGVDSMVCFVFSYLMVIKCFLINDRRVCALVKL